MNKSCKSWAKLPDEFTQGDWEFKVLERDGDCVFLAKENGNGVTHYEAARVISQKARVVFGKEYPAGVRLPSNEEWGLYGISLPLDRLQARQRFNAWVRASASL